MRRARRRIQPETAMAIVPVSPKPVFAQVIIICHISYHLWEICEIIVPVSSKPVHIHISHRLILSECIKLRRFMLLNFFNNSYYMNEERTHRTTAHFYVFVFCGFIYTNTNTNTRWHKIGDTFTWTWCSFTCFWCLSWFQGFFRLCCGPFLEYV